MLSQSSSAFAEAHTSRQSSHVLSPQVLVLPKEVTGDDSIDAYVGTGGLVLGRTYSGSATKKYSIASCLSCVWKYSIYCRWSDEASPCLHAVMSCPKGMILYRVLFGQTNDDMQSVGSVCHGSGEPVTRRTIERKIRQHVIRYVPNLKPTTQPSRKTLTSMKVFAQSGQDRKFTPKKFTLSGHQVSLVAQARWRWSWGDGSSRWYSSPGGKYPDGKVTHQYRSTGVKIIKVHTQWNATYTIAGVGTFPAQGDQVTQDATLRIRVKPSGSVLVAH